MYNYYGELQTLISSLAGLNSKVADFQTYVIAFSLIIVALLAFDIVKNWRFGKK